ncbi:hypothetical protein [Nonomuraea sp. NPDC050786]|uniref:hypothetical protein n=1 Tax=Nonomuraea sp. NPDC050786 TaxID=3154840 RepID=UPI0033C8AAD8
MGATESIRTDLPHLSGIRLDALRGDGDPALDLATDRAVAQVARARVAAGADGGTTAERLD